MFSFLKLTIYLKVLSVWQLENLFLILTWQSGNYNGAFRVVVTKQKLAFLLLWQLTKHFEIGNPTSWQSGDPMHSFPFKWTSCKYTGTPSPISLPSRRWVFASCWESLPQNSLSPGDFLRDPRSQHSPRVITTFRRLHLMRTEELR